MKKKKKKPTESESYSSVILVRVGAQNVTAGVTMALRTVLNWTALGMNQNQNIWLKQLKVTRKYLAAFLNKSSSFYTCLSMYVTYV